MKRVRIYATEIYAGPISLTVPLERHTLETWLCCESHFFSQRAQRITTRKNWTVKVAVSGQLISLSLVPLHRHCILNLDTN